MLSIGMPELILILAIALIVIGPKKLPEVATYLGRAMREFKKATSDIRDAFDEADRQYKSPIQLDSGPQDKAPAVSEESVKKPLEKAPISSESQAKEPLQSEKASASEKPAASENADPQSPPAPSLDALAESEYEAQSSAEMLAEEKPSPPAPADKADDETQATGSSPAKGQ